MKILVIGGGAVGKTIARAFAPRKNYEVTIIDFESESEQKNLISNVKWISGDACDTDVLKLAEADTADVLVAATGDDQANLVVCLIAKTEFGISKCIARVNHPKNEGLFNKKWGVDFSVSTPDILETLVEDAISVDEIVPIMTISGSGAKILKLTIGNESQYVGKMIKDLDVPENVILCAVNRGEFSYSVSEEIIFNAGDELIFISNKNSQ